MSKQATTDAQPMTPVKAARIRDGLTLAQVIQRCEAEGVSLTEGYLSRLERGHYAGSPRVRAVLADVLGLDPVEDFKRTAGRAA